MECRTEDDYQGLGVFVGCYESVTIMFFWVVKI
jgi:hypothetical protein